MKQEDELQHIASMIFLVEKLPYEKILNLLVCMYSYALKFNNALCKTIENNLMFFPTNFNLKGGK